MPDGPRIPSLPWKQAPSRVSRASAHTGDTALGHACSNYCRLEWLVSDPGSALDHAAVFHTALPQGGLSLSARHSSLLHAEGAEPEKSSILFRVDQGLAR